MRARLTAPILAATLLALPVCGSAEEVRLSPEQTFALASEMLQAGEAAKARALAEVLLQRDGQDVPALILASEAAIAAGDPGAARDRSTAAWRLADVDAARYASARLIALSLAETGSITRAQFWLRRARHHAPTERSAASVAEDYRYLRRVNPLHFQVDLSVAPTSNINNGTTNDTITLPGLPITFVLSGDSKPLSGTEITASGSLSWRLRETPRTMTRIVYSGLARTYRLSGDARDTQPDAEGSDYAETQVSVGLSHLWLPEGADKPWRFRAEQGRFWFGGAPWTDFTRASVGRGVTLGPSDRLDFGLTAEHVSGIETEDSDALTLRAGWSRDFEGHGALDLSLKRRSVRADGADRAYEAIGGLVGWTFEGSGASVSYEVETRDYESTAFLLTTRTDTRHSLRAAVPVPGVELYGFRPVLTAEHSIQQSNVTRFETETTGAGLAFRSAF